MPDKLSLLLAEDSPEDAFAIRRYLEQSELDYELLYVETSEEAQHIIEGRSFDCILLDYQLPGYDGIQLLKFIRTHMKTPVAIIILTGSGNEQTAVEVMKAGAEDYIVKNTLSSQRLQTAIQQAIQTVNYRATIDQQNTELKAFAAELKRSNESLRHFAYVASHDMREPLRTILSYLQLLDRRYSDQLDNDAKEFIGFAVDGAKRLTSFLEELLNFSRINNTKLQPARVNTRALIDRLLGDLAPLIEQTGAQVVVGDLGEVKGNENLLWQLFQNLLTNAIKFRREALPLITIGSEHHPDETVFWIKDNGIGIQAKDFDQIFVMFHQLNYKKFEGTGIGLATCKAIVERHSGRIWFESTFGEGTTFYFTIPDELNQ